MERRRRLASTAGLVALVLVDLVLVFAVLRLVGRPSTAEATATSAPTLQVPPDLPTQAPAPTPSSSSTRTFAAPVPLTTIVAAVDGTIAWRATTGSCGRTNATVSFSVDGGKVWRNATSPYPVLMRVQPTDASRAFVAGADPNCVMGVRSTVDGGTTWAGTGPGTLSETLTRDAKDATKVQTPGGRTVAPCGTLVVIDLARNSATGAQALCADGTIRATTDDGRNWPQSGQIAGALALDSRTVGGKVTAYVASLTSSCDGIRLSSLTDGAVTDLGCAAPGVVPTPGSVAISAPLPDAGWLQVGADTWRSSDGLVTWNRA